MKLCPSSDTTPAQLASQKGPTMSASTMRRASGRLLISPMKRRQTRRSANIVPKLSSSRCLRDQVSIGVRARS